MPEETNRPPATSAMNVVKPGEIVRAYWDSERVKDLICAPTRLLREEPWGAWVRQRGGISAVHSYLRGLRLPAKQVEVLNLLLDQPGVPSYEYARRLNVERTTFFRHRNALVETLVNYLNQWVLTVDEPASPPVRTRALRPTNLPALSSAFIGRQEEVGSICGQLLRPEVRLLTLTGPGGMGKTSLSLQVGRALLQRFHDGVFFIPLAAIRNPALVPSTILQTLGVKEDGDQTVMSLLREHLRARELLLILDNIEQVLGAGPAITELLATASQLKILVTSRALLQIYGEHEFVVPPLALPATNPLPDLEVLAAASAVALFVERAIAASPAFALDEENAATIAAICHRLEGLPLAIELAAARVKILTPQAILARLNKQLALLTGGPRDLPPRQQSLRSAIDWSYQLLDQEMQQLFLRLGVFAGGCSLQAVERVCFDAAAPQSGGSMEVLDQLAALLNNSMIRRKAGFEGEPRFIMLEVIREYALEQLAGTGEAEELHRRHAQAYLELAEQAEPALIGAQQGRWLDRLEEEHDNFRAALEWALGRREGQLALRMVGALWRFWQIRGYVLEGRRWIEQALAHRGELAPGQRLVLAKTLWGAGWLAWVQRDIKEMQRCFSESFALACELGDQHIMALALHGQGWLAWEHEGNYAQATRLYEQSLPLFEAAGDVEHTAWTLLHLGRLALAQGEYERGIALCQESQARLESLGHQMASAQALMHLGEAFLEQRAYEHATLLLQRAMAIYHELRAGEAMIPARSSLARVALAQGNAAQALALYQESLAQAQEHGQWWSVAAVLQELGRIYSAQGDFKQAAEYVWGSLNIQRTLGSQEGLVQSLEQLVELLVFGAEQLDDLRRAARLLGTIEAFREQRPTWAGVDRSEQEQLRRAIQTRLGREAFQSEWELGRSMRPEQAASYAQAHGL